MQTSTTILNPMTPTNTLLNMLATQCPHSTKLGKDMNYWLHQIQTYFLPQATFRLTTAFPVRHFDLPQMFLARYFWIQFVFCNLLSFAYAPTSIPQEHVLGGQHVLVTIPSCTLIQQFQSQKQSKTIIQSLCAFRVTFVLEYATQQYKIEFLDFVLKSFDEAIDRNAITLLSNQQQQQQQHKDDENDEDSNVLNHHPNSLLLQDSTSPVMQQQKDKEHEEQASNTTTQPPALLSIPDPVANENGIHVRLMRALEIADVVNSMKDLIMFSQAKQLGALQSLHQMATLIDQHTPSRHMTPQTQSPQTYLAPVQSPQHQQQQSDTTQVNNPSQLTSPTTEIKTEQLVVSPTTNRVKTPSVSPKQNPVSIDPVPTETVHQDIEASEDQPTNPANDHDDEAASVCSNTSASLLLDAFLKSEPVSPNGSTSPVPPQQQQQPIDSNDDFVVPTTNTNASTTADPIDELLWCTTSSNPSAEPSPVGNQSSFSDVKSDLACTELPVNVSGTTEESLSATHSITNSSGNQLDLSADS